MSCSEPNGRGRGAVPRRGFWAVVRRRLLSSAGACCRPSRVTAGRPFSVSVTLTAGGNQMLHGVRLALQLPQGWAAVPAGRTVFGTVRPGRAIAATFRVRPPADSPALSAVLHATATMGTAMRENGITVTVRAA